MPALFLIMYTHLFILYDSIFNSVFASQVIAPLIKQLEKAPHSRAHIISFERKLPSKQHVQSLNLDARIEVHLLKKIPFLCTISLQYAARKLCRLLQNIKPTHITARGPLAGWIAAHATNRPIPVVVQARGLAAQEYLYTHQYSFWHRWRARQYASIERFVYGFYAQHSHVTIHAVSDALKNYLYSEWNAPVHKIIVATHDIPPSLSAHQIKKWRTKIRTQLLIPEKAYVYVYSGSAHAWQCPDQTIQFFANAYHKDACSFLLILSQNSAPFKALLIAYAVPETAYAIRHVPHADIYHYLAAADAGLLFRKAHCINWVARPTKALEYRAVGLKIIHNRTVALLCNEQFSAPSVNARLHEASK